MDRSMMPVPSPFGPPPQAPPSPMGQGGPQPATPVDLLQSLKELVGTPVRTPEPVYRPGFKQPPKPDPEDVRKRAKRLYDQSRQWRLLVHTTLRWVRQDLTGAFSEDLEARTQGFQDEYISTALSDERNLIISKSSALEWSFQKLHTSTDNRAWAQRLEDFDVWLRRIEQLRHSESNRPLEIDECTVYVDTGMYASRDVFAPEMTDCPVDMRMMDPTQVHPVYDGRNGLREVYRVYRDSARAITQDYGDFTPEAKAKLEKQFGRIEDETEFDVVEYWDRWWRMVSIGDQLILPVTEHKYGDCPWTIQYGGYGEPMFTHSEFDTDSVGQISSAWIKGRSSFPTERMTKATPYLYYRLKSHSIYEAVMARFLDGFKKEINPPYIRYRSDMAAEKEFPQMDTNAGMGNEAMLGEEKVEPIPMLNTGAADRVIAQVNQDRRTGSMPPEAYGVMDKSNISSVAQQGANDAGMQFIAPITKSREMAMSRRYERINRMMANFGHVAKYGGDAVSPIIVPIRRRGTQAGTPAYEFDREVIDRVGPSIQVNFSRVDPRDWPGLVASGGQAVDKGFALRRDIRALMFGDHDFDSFYAEWSEETALFMAVTNPDYQKLNIGMEFDKKIEEAEGNPRLQAYWSMKRDEWKQATMPPPQPPPMPGVPGQQPQQPQQPGMGGPPPQPGMGGPPQQAQGPQQAFPSPQGVQVGAPGGISYPSVGQGPGAMGAPVGRPY